MRVRLGLGVLLVLFLTVWAAPAAQAEDVFLIVSVSDEFDTSLPDGVEDFGSAVIVVTVGSLTNNVPDPRQTRFLPGSEPPTIPLGDLNFTDLQGNESTIFGSYTVEEFESTEPHMLTPGATAVDPVIQAAVFAASADIAALASEGGASSTGEIADIVKSYTGDSDLTHTEIAEALFGSTAPLGGEDLGEGEFTCEAEGELFPHPKDEVEPLFAFELSFDQDGTFSAIDICLLVEAEVKEGCVNLKKKGTVSIAIYSSDTFDSDEIDEDTVEIDGVFAGKVQFSCKKATAKFSVKELVDEGVLTSDTEEITIRAFLTDGSCIEATIPINVK